MFEIKSYSFEYEHFKFDLLFCRTPWICTFCVLHFSELLFILRLTLQIIVSIFTYDMEFKCYSLTGIPISFWNPVILTWRYKKYIACEWQLNVNLILRTLTGKKHPQIKRQRLQLEWISTFGLLVIKSTFYKRFLNWNKIFLKDKVITGKTLFFVVDPFCTPYSICIKIVF